MSFNNGGNGRKKGRRLPVLLYNCDKCPAYCCSYEHIEVSRKDIARIAAHFSLTYRQAEAKYTKILEGDRVLRHRKDNIFKRACEFLDTEARRCTVYEARPAVCRSYPDSRRCGYYDFLASERRRQDDKDFIPDA